MRYRRGLILHFEDDASQAKNLARTITSIPDYLRERQKYFDGREDPALIPSLERFCRDFNLGTDRRIQTLFSSAKIGDDEEDEDESQPISKEMYQAAEREVHQLVGQIDMTPDLPVYVNVASGIVGRRLIHEVLPGVIITDTAFPLNGEVTVNWLQRYGLSTFPVIGLSATPFDRLSPRVQAFYYQQSGKVYLEKPEVKSGVQSQVLPPLFYGLQYTHDHQEMFLRSYTGGAEFKDEE